MGRWELKLRMTEQRFPYGVRPKMLAVGMGFFGLCGVFYVHIGLAGTEIRLWPTPVMVSGSPVFGLAALSFLFVGAAAGQVVWRRRLGLRSSQRHAYRRAARLSVTPAGARETAAAACSPVGPVRPRPSAVEADQACAASPTQAQAMEQQATEFTEWCGHATGWKSECYRFAMRSARVAIACTLVAACSVPLAPGPATRSWGYPDQGGGQAGGGALGGSGDDAGDAAPDGGASDAQDELSEATAAVEAAPSTIVETQSGSDSGDGS